MNMQIDTSSNTNTSRYLGAGNNELLQFSEKILVHEYAKFYAVWSFVSFKFFQKHVIVSRAVGKL